MLLQDKVVIVSGVGPGLGQANARALAREGARVILAARNAEYLGQVQKEIESDGGRALAIPTNLVDPDQVRALVDGAIDAYGRLDGLVNNAFRMDTFEPFEAVDLVKWRKIFEVNVWGALGLTQACLPHLKKAAAEHGDASVVFIISMSMRNIRPLEGGYSSSKAAIQTAAKTMAVELGPAGVRVNCVAPGMDRRPERRDVHRLGVGVARNLARRRARRDRGPHPAARHPASGRDREQRRLLRVAVVAGRHRPDARRQRR